MSKDWYQDIVDLNKAYGHYIGKRPHIPPFEVVDLQSNLVKEEIQETFDAILEKDLPKIADGIIDSIVVLLGLAVVYGIDVGPIWEEVHKANMSKVDGPVREDGKRLKPSEWKPPDVEKILKEQGG